MDKQQLLSYLDKLDASLDRPAMLYIYGSAVCILRENYRTDSELWKGGRA